MSGLIYIDKSRVIPGVPARDLTDEEVKEHGGEKSLVGSGLYAKPKKTDSKDKT